MLKLFSALSRSPLAAIAVFLACPSYSIHAQRLPDSVRPEHYTLHLTPDLDKATFSGDETIDVSLTQPSESITLNAAELQFQSVVATAKEIQSDGKVTLDAEKQQATLVFPKALPAGAVSLKIAYTGILNDKLRGFYLSKANDRRYAVTQFESTDARRAFPSFDEPGFKATFAITVTAPKDDMVISNTNVIADKPGPTAALHTVQFAPTPKMSTYLVAVLVGRFSCISGSSDGVPIRACATPERVEYAHFAVTAAEYILHYYNTYFGIRYPMPKLDMIGIPDFEAGAMENFGAITYREPAMLVDEQHAPESARIEVASVIAHEMAHQWFGDMVTMQWWNNIWLNEGFATWMSNKPLEAWKPEWHIEDDVAASLNGAMNLDAQRTTRTIRAEADTPDEINEMFDGITYQKGASILHMVENYVGEETFRQGIHNYLAAHLYGNATAEDFWSVQTATSHKPVDKIMESFIAQPGVPLLSFGNGTVSVTQSRFFLNPQNAGPSNQSWTLPVCTLDGGRSTKPSACELLTGQHFALKITDATPFFANAGAAGYYRSAYSEEDYKSLVADAEKALTAPERIHFAGDQLALMRAGKSTAGDYLSLAASLKNDSSPTLLESVAGGITTLWSRVAATSEQRDALSHWIITTYEPRFTSLGEPGSKDSSSQQQLRADLLNLLGRVANDRKVIEESRSIAERYLSGSKDVNPTLATAALDVAAQHGDTALFDRLQQAAEMSKDPILATQALYELARFEDPVLNRRALDYAVSGKVRNQDAARLFAVALQSTATQQSAWQYIQDNWPKVSAQLTTASGGGLVASTGAFCTEEKRDEVTRFFTTHPVASSASALGRAQNAINDCVALRAGQGSQLQQWLAANSTSAAQP